ncbi:hypothetical protein [Aureibacter tunicatorum]|uniref:Uncharacterized protein n=1 Tax=Aureibacter tunicatorum TaxID=866807 RepID=A0AAE3XJU1_9BACT|nr:hypothetical protein [Aureibacter tunicatorum]MDR6238202.1 hypothetical protein [Aureibacter tunicatorum]BDD03235.1 hypothetical protein AUTU_07180 [Aureibacter tunicatorum]
MKMISIVMVIDVVGALADGCLTENYYLLDNNKLKGSQDEGTQQLKTAISKGDSVVWSVVALECESYVDIVGVSLGGELEEKFALKKELYPYADIGFWKADIKSKIDSEHPYYLTLQVGNEANRMRTELPAYLINSES